MNVGLYNLFFLYLKSKDLIIYNAIIWIILLFILLCLFPFDLIFIFFIVIILYWKLLNKLFFFLLQNIKHWIIHLFPLFLLFFFNIITTLRKHIWGKSVLCFLYSKSWYSFILWLLQEATTAHLNGLLMEKEMDNKLTFLYIVITHRLWDQNNI